MSSKAVNLLDLPCLCQLYIWEELKFTFGFDTSEDLQFLVSDVSIQNKAKSKLIEELYLRLSVLSQPLEVKVFKGDSNKLSQSRSVSD